MHRSRSLRRGNVIVSALCLVVLLGFAALVVDLGFLRTARLEVQNAADFAAFSGVQQLDGTRDGVDRAESTALRIGNAHRAGGRVPQITAAQLSFGVYDPVSARFRPGGAVDQINALRVSPSVSDFPTALGGVLGVNTMGARGDAIAYRPPRGSAGRVTCVLPLAVAECAVSAALANGGSIDLRFSSGVRDSVAWASLDGSSGASYFRNQLDPASTSACKGTAVGSQVRLQNGQLATALSLVRDVILGTNSGMGRAVAWDVGDWGPAPQWGNRIQPSDDNGDGVVRAADGETHTSTISRGRYGYSLQGAVMIFATPDGDGDGVADFCEPGGASYTGDRPLAGFVWAALYDVDHTGGDTAMRLRLNGAIEDSNLVTDGGGQLNYGLTAPTAPRLVSE